MNRGVGKGCHVVFDQKITDEEGAVTGRVVMVEKPLVCRPQFSPLLPNFLAQSFQGVTVAKSVDCFTLLEEFMKDDTLRIKENSEDHFDVRSHLASFFGS